MLPTDVKTTGDLMSIALMAEREAIKRYSGLAKEMREGNNGLAAALFERMVAEEQEHERLLLEWMKQENIKENPEINPVSWRDPNISTTYNDEARDPYYSTPYRALAFAVHNEEIAFRFYAHVAAESENEAVRKYAEILAREELGHAALLRAERRRAFHTEREADVTEPKLDPQTVHNEADLLTAAIHIDHYLADEMKIFTSGSPEINSLEKETRRQIISNENALSNTLSAGEDITRKLEEIESYNLAITEKANDPNSRLQRLCASCDHSFAFYDTVVETTKDEAIMLAAQKLTSSALDRIGILKQALGSRCGCDE